jgi:heptosyltransferase-2
MCDDCNFYDPVKTSILIVKLDAVGDVLRTTAILHGLRERYPSSEITWITRRSALDVFENNTLVDQVLAYESTEAILRCAVQEFDVVINLDTASESAVLASHVKGKQKLGYGLDQKGNVFAFNPEAEVWMEMGAFDQRKKKNTRTYQELMLEICGLAGTKKEIILNLSQREKEFAASFARGKNLLTGSVKLGINTGASPRWQYKQWTMEGFEALLRTVVAETDWTVLLYGGPYEVDRNAKLASINPARIIDTGANNSLRQFFALVSLSDVFLTGDTLALHVATALKKKIVAYFGPTSIAEIDSYESQIDKVHADLDCLCCYKPRCDFQPHCMNSLSSSFVFERVRRAVDSLPSVGR